MTSQDGALPSTSNDSVPSHLDPQKITAAALACLREAGYDATTIRSIAKRLDCAVGTIYRYFRDKRELLFAVTQQTFAPVARLAEAASFEEGVLAYHQQALREPGTYRLMFWLAGVGSTPAGQAKVSVPSARRKPAPPPFVPCAVPPVVRRFVQCWALKLGSEALAHRAWAMLHGAAMLEWGPEQTLSAVRAVVEPAVQPAPVAARTRPGLPAASPVVVDAFEPVRPPVPAGAALEHETLVAAAAATRGEPAALSAAAVPAGAGLTEDLALL